MPLSLYRNKSRKTSGTHWFQAAEESRWMPILIVTAISLSLGGVSLAISLDTLGQKSTSTSLRSLWNIGFGKVDNRAIVDMPSIGLLSAVALSNTPQALFSVIYLVYNNLLTCMLMEHEWNDYAHYRKPLRVSSPRGTQRSTYWLQLPYSYALPLVAASGLSHWLISQSLFLARIYAYDVDGVELPDLTLKTCGYSPIAIMFTLIVSCVMCLALGILSFRKYSGSIPFAGHCSFVLSAACHPPPNDVNAAELPVMWGAIIKPDGSAVHTFTSFSVRPAKIEPEHYVNERSIHPFVGP